jgi:hypothetical protein
MWPKKVKSCVDVAGVIALNFADGNTNFTKQKSFVVQAPAFIRKRLRQRLKLKKGVADEIKSEIKKVGRLKNVE